MAIISLCLHLEEVAEELSGASFRKPLAPIHEADAMAKRLLNTTTLRIKVQHMNCRVR